MKTCKGFTITLGRLSSKIFFRSGIEIIATPYTKPDRIKKFKGLTLPCVMEEKREIVHPVILFDGVCNLCSSVVQFVIKRDKKDVFRFASLQSGLGIKILKDFQLNSTEYASFILFSNGKVYTKSTAALEVARQLRGSIRFLYMFTIIPTFIRDFIYNIIAKNRYKWFGKKAVCWIPEPQKTIKLF